MEGRIGVGVLVEKLCKWELPNATLESPPQPFRHWIALPIVFGLLSLMRSDLKGHTG